MVESILSEAERITSQDRNDAYGHPHANLGRIAGMWSAYVGIELSRDDVAMMMTLVKISRHRHQPKRDNLVDIAGYARIAEIANECCGVPMECNRKQCPQDIPTTPAEPQADMSNDKKTCPAVGDRVMVNGIEMVLESEIRRDADEWHWWARYPGASPWLEIYLKDGKWHYLFDEPSHA